MPVSVAAPPAVAVASEEACRWKISSAASATSSEVVASVALTSEASAEVAAVAVRSCAAPTLRARVRLTLEEIDKGVEKKLKVKKQVACSHCHGDGTTEKDGKKQCDTCHGSGVVISAQRSIFGMMQTQSVCPTCEGTGEVITKPCSFCKGKGTQIGEEVVSFRIPAGVAAGMQFSIQGKGNAAPRGGIPGDLQVVIQEEEDPNLIRNGNDLIYNLLISVPTAAQGGSVEVPTIGGKARVNIAAGTQPGKVLRLRGKGLPSVNGYGKGDLLVNVNVFIPKLNEKADASVLETMSAPRLRAHGRSPQGDR